MNLYVYYKLASSEASNQHIKVLLMQAELKAQFPKLSFQLLKRPDTDETGRETWMETYDLSEIDINDFRGVLDQLALAANLPQPRKNEIFISL